MLRYGDHVVWLPMNYRGHVVSVDFGDPKGCCVLVDFTGRTPGKDAVAGWGCMVVPIAELQRIP
jgi:hypothetical protein